MKEKNVNLITAIIAFVLLIAIGFSVAAYGIFNNGIAQDNDARLDVSESVGDGVELMSVTGTSPDGFPIQTVTATITPADDSISCVWSVAWKTNTENVDKAVGDYITLTPNNRSVEVKCIKAFGADTINLKCEAGVLKKSAVCVISFVGKAQTISIVTDELLQGDTYVLAKGTNGVMNVNVSNKFNSVKSNLSVTLGAVGELYFATYTSARPYSVITNVVKRNLNDLASRFASVSIENNVIRIVPIAVVKGYVGDTTVVGQTVTNDNRYLDGPCGDGTLQTEADFNAANVDNCYFTITISDSISGLSKVIKFKILSHFTVNTSDSTITF